MKSPSIMFKPKYVASLALDDPCIALFYCEKKKNKTGFDELLRGWSFV